MSKDNLRDTINFLFGLWFWPTYTYVWTTYHLGMWVAAALFTPVLIGCVGLIVFAIEQWGHYETNREKLQEVTPKRVTLREYVEGAK